MDNNLLFAAIVYNIMMILYGSSYIGLLDGPPLTKNSRSAIEYLRRLRTRQRTVTPPPMEIPEIGDIYMQESAELRTKINHVHNMEYASDFVSRIMNDTITSNKVMSDPMFIYNRSVGRRMSPIHSVHRSLQKIPKNLLTLVHKDYARGFNGAFSRHGNFFLSSFQDLTLRVYHSMDPLNMRLLSTRAAEHVQWSVLDVAFSPDERTVAYSGWADKLYLMDIMDEDMPVRCINMRCGEQYLMCAFSIKFDSLGRELIAGGYEGTIFIGDVLTGQRISYIERAHPMDINALDFADSSGHVFVSGGDDAVLRVFDRRTLRGGEEGSSEPVGIFAGHTCGVTFIDSKGDSRYLLSNGKDQTIRLWDMRRMGSVSQFNDMFENLRRSPAFHWDYRYRGMPSQFTGSNLVPVLDADHSLMVLRGHEVRQTLIRARFSPAITTGQRFVYSGGARGCWHLWDLLTGEMLTMNVQSQHSRTVVRDVSWHPTEPVVFTTDFEGNIKCFHYRSLEGDDGLARQLSINRVPLQSLSSSDSDSSLTYS